MVEAVVNQITTSTSALTRSEVTLRVNPLLLVILVWSFACMNHLLLVIYLKPNHLYIKMIFLRYKVFWYVRCFLDSHNTNCYVHSEISVCIHGLRLIALFFLQTELDIWVQRISDLIDSGFQDGTAEFWMVPCPLYGTFIFFCLLLIPREAYFVRLLKRGFLASLRSSVKSETTLSRPFFMCMLA